MIGKQLFIPVAVAGCLSGTFLVFAGVRAAAKGQASPRKHTVRGAAHKVASEVHSSKVAARRWDRRLDALPSRGVYKRFFRVTATAYMPIHEGIEGGRYTCTLRDGRSAHGVAVDPHVIPLGTRLWIPGYGHAVADDVGSAIKGHHIDVRVQERERMHRWGTRQMQVYVLAEPSENG